MPITTTIDIIENALWQQHDARDPLGVWGFRTAVLGDASGGSIKVFVQVPATKSGKYIYTFYSLNVTHDAGGALLNPRLKSRLLTSWPNIDPQAGVQAYSFAKHTRLSGVINFTAPIEFLDEPLISEPERYILFYDPRTTNNAITVAELEILNNGVGDNYSFEGYGYFWDRGAMAAPGGLRHPGSL